MTFARSLTYDEFEVGETEIPLTDTDAVALVREYITRLDGERRTLVVIFGSGSHLAVGGGGDGGHVVYATFDNSTFHQLVDPSVVDGEPVKVVAGGQPGVYERNRVVTLADALHAAEAFVATGTLAEDLTWAET
jgi:hypothetical protein